MRIKVDKPAGVTLTLELTDREAWLLHDVLGRLSGKLSGPRSMFNSLLDALEANGYRGGFTDELAGGLTLPDSWAGFEKGLS